MGKPADPLDTADPSRSWARHLNWNPLAARKQPDQHSLPTTEPAAGRVGIPSGGVHDAGSTSAKHTTSNAEHKAIDALNTSDTSKHGPDIVAPSYNAPVNQLSFAPTLVDTEAQGEKPPAIDVGVDEQKREPKPPISQRAKAGSKRFVRHTKNAIFHSWINLLLVFVPIGIVARAANLDAAIVFAMNAIAVIPLAGLLAHATEAVASRLGDTLGALLNVSFGNAVELIIL